LSTTAIIIANDPCPPHGVVHACLEKILGDPILLWVLRVLPEEIERIHVITGDDHEKTADLLAHLKANGEIKCHAECHQNPNTACSLLEFSKTATDVSIRHDERVLLLCSSQPLINPALLQTLASTNGMLVADDSTDSMMSAIGPVSLPWSSLQSVAEQFSSLTGEQAESGLAELRSCALKAIQLNPYQCCPDDLLWVQTRADLTKIQNIARTRIVNHWLDSGVALMDPNSTIIGPRVDLAGRGILIEAQARLEGSVSVGESTTIGQGSIVRDSTLGANTEIRPYCVINGSVIGDGVKIGPFANIREGSRFDTKVRIGNFVETKKARLHKGAKANHLSYLGDCEVGENTNIGAGCITCNYDGFSKHRTVIGKSAFIGSDCQMVAPVTIGDGAILGAGTTLTSDAPKDALVLTRPETRVIVKGAEKIRARIISILNQN